MRLHLHPNGRPGEDEKKRAFPNYENANGHVDVQRDPTQRTDAARVTTGSSMGQSPSVRVFWLGTTWTEGLIGRPPGLAAAPGAFPTPPVPTTCFNKRR